MRHAALLGCTLAGLLALAPPAGAQGVIRGALYDSLRTQGPVARAEVVLFGTSRRDTTDARGRFEFVQVPAGRHEVGHWAPWLDSLAVPALRAAVEVGSDRRAVEVTLATPSRAVAQRALCGAPLEGGGGIVLGEVRDAGRRPLAGVPVYGWWHETVLGKGQLDRRTMATGDTTDAAGMYVLCGIPQGAALEVHAAVTAALAAPDAPGATDASGSADWSVAVPMDQAFVRQDVTVGAGGATVIVTGRLVASEEVPIADATVRLRSDTTVTARSLADGTFRLRVPARTGHVQVRALGFAPRDAMVEPPAEDGSGATTFELGDLRLQTVQEIGRVTVIADGWTRQRLEYEERKRYNFQGTFFDDEELAKLPIIRPAVLAMKTPRSFLDKNGVFTLEFNGGRCVPRLFVDGADVSERIRYSDPPDRRRRPQGDLAYWLQLAKRIEVYRAAFAPARYTDFDGCGAIVIWTR